MKKVCLYYEKYGLLLFFGALTIFFLVLCDTKVFSHVDMIEPSVAIENIREEVTGEIDLQFTADEDGAYDV